VRFCSIPDCERRHEARDLCQTHYVRWKIHGDPQVTNRGRVCTVADCGRPHKAGGLCGLHYLRLKRTGSLDVPDRRLAAKRYRVITRRDHPLAMRNGRVYEHRAVLYDQLGPKPEPCHWCGRTVEWGDRDHPLFVDHVDHDRQNNDPTNLVPSCGTCNGSRRRGSEWTSQYREVA